TPEVWSLLAKAQLAGLRIRDSIGIYEKSYIRKIVFLSALITKILQQFFIQDSYIRADDPSNFQEVIDYSSRAGKFEDLVRYLQMCRKRVREPMVDSELLFAYAKTERYSDLEEFLRQPNVAQIQVVGERCYEHELYQAA